MESRTAFNHCICTQARLEERLTKIKRKKQEAIIIQDGWLSSFCWFSPVQVDRFHSDSLPPFHQDSQSLLYGLFAGVTTTTMAVHMVQV